MTIEKIKELAGLLFTATTGHGEESKRARDTAANIMEQVKGAERELERMRETIKRMREDTITPDDLWRECQELAEQIIGEAYDRVDDDYTDIAHETIDGHSWVTYTMKAQQVLAASEYDSAYVDAMGDVPTHGEGGPLNWEAMAYYAILEQTMERIEIESCDNCGECTYQTWGDGPHPCKREGRPGEVFCPACQANPLADDVPEDCGIIIEHRETSEDGDTFTECGTIGADEIRPHGEGVDSFGRMVVKAIEDEGYQLDAFDGADTFTDESTRTGGTPPGAECWTIRMVGFTVEQVQAVAIEARLADEGGPMFDSIEGQRASAQALIDAERKRLDGEG